MPWIDDLPAELADTLSDELKQHPSIRKYETFDKFVEGFVNADSRLGSSIRIPGEDAGDSDWQEFTNKLVTRVPKVMLKPDFSKEDQAAEFWKTLGKPDAADKYPLPEGVELPEATVAEFREAAFEANMTPAQFKRQMQAFYDRYSAGKQELDSKLEKETGKLKDEWGMTYPDRVQAAKAINEQFYPGRPFDSLNPAEIRALYNVHVATTGKGAQAPNQGPEQKGLLTPEEAEEQAAEIMRRIHDPKSGLTREEIDRLSKKRIDLLVKYVPKYALKK